MNTIEDFYHGGILKRDSNYFLSKKVNSGIKWLIRGETVDFVRRKTKKDGIKSLCRQFE